VSRQRGRASRNRLADEQRTRITGLLKVKYEDFGPTLAAEKLPHLEASPCRGRRLASVKLARGSGSRIGGVSGVCFRCGSAARFGELIRIDGSPRIWFEERGPRWAQTQC
jgi:hypothetical protein